MSPLKINIDMDPPGKGLYRPTKDNYIHGIPQDFSTYEGVLYNDVKYHVSPAGFYLDNDFYAMLCAFKTNGAVKGGCPRRFLVDVDCKEGDHKLARNLIALTSNKQVVGTLFFTMRAAAHGKKYIVVDYLCASGLINKGVGTALLQILYNHIFLIRGHYPIVNITLDALYEPVGFYLYHQYRFFPGQDMGDYDRWKKMSAVERAAQTKLWTVKMYLLVGKSDDEPGTMRYLLQNWPPPKLKISR